MWVSNSVARPLRFRPHACANLSAIYDTGFASSSAGPKFQPDAKSFGPSSNRSARIRYPRRGSSTNCQGRMAEGFRIKQACLARKGLSDQESVGWSPVTTADHISGPSAGKSHAVNFVHTRREEGIPVGASDKFRATFRIRIRIVPPHDIVLTIRPYPFAVVIALITRHVYYCT